MNSFVKPRSQVVSRRVAETPREGLDRWQTLSLRVLLWPRTA